MSTSPRPFNFSAGPATLPEEVLQQAAAEMLDWRGSGMGVMEMSHRGKEFTSIAAQAEADLRTLLAIPSHFKVLFMQGGAIAENAIIPMNLSRGGVVDHVITGSWSQKSAKEARKYCTAKVTASNEADHHTTLPAHGSWQLSGDAAYVHVCSNETIHGVEMHALPDLAALGSKAPLVIDCSSHIASRTIDWSRVGLAYAGAQKNIGPSGLTLVIVREDLIGHALPDTPSAFDYQVVADNGSMYNTPPTYAWYIAGLVFQWALKQREVTPQGELTGLAAIEARNIAKAQLLYDYIDGSGFYTNKVAADCRSRMNIPFFLPDDSLNAAFLASTQAAGLLQLKGHKSVGGMRASIYNAMPLAGVQALVDHMKQFAASHG
ncbi:3-phosphoserine/phosphohydroxythreonine transaminase [Aquabacterium sp.]|uniref:3-phosphoserine/phosphohydroxythreonine transaminase n=1 Tax=Aquabacterium TaxID=92793 RepID=UPI001E0E1F79|nr:3-phosphoserine/phosphohydroxythreonine transaminase [Aquabacterium sp.]MBT9609117.1 3-phosphoserine/phosphohydroxythreonine transaminase [Aquabacterium sp.]